MTECNKYCTCGPNCRNRVVQKGRKVVLEIFKTDDKGWGVRAGELIEPGQFVTEYVGEIITEKEAKIRERLCGDYLFNVDSNQRNDSYVIDAAKYGNVSRFFNHSCQPNLYVKRVYINSKRLPHMAFFAAKPIKKNEELSFNYKPDWNVIFEKNVLSKTKCFCAASKCRGTLPLVYIQ